MTFNEIVNEVLDRMNLTSNEATTRVGREVNSRYKRVASSIGLNTSRPVSVSQAVTLGNQYVTFSGITKIVSVHNRTAGIRLTEVTPVEIPVIQIDATGTADSGTTTTVVDTERTEATDVFTGSVIQFTSGTLLDESSVITDFDPATDTITFSPAVSTSVLAGHTYRILAGNEDDERVFAVYAMGATTVTIILDSIPTTAHTLFAEGLSNLSTLSGTGTPAFAEDFHDILVFGAVADELRKMEKQQLADRAESDFAQRLSDLRMFIAKSAYLDLYQGKVVNDKNWWKEWV